MSAPTYRALLIANSTFPSDPQSLPDLEGPRNDLSLLRDALSDDRYGLFAADNVRLVAERTMPEVLRELEMLLRSTTARDYVLVYYSGHGRLDQSNEFYFCTRDTHTDYLRSTAVNAGIVSKMVDESAAGTTVILLDCCHAGAFKGGGEVADSLAGGGRFVITSSRAGELANDADGQNHASMFTSCLVAGLRGGAPDDDGDGLIGLSGLYDYVFTQLGALGRQIPQKRFSGSGDVPIALRPPSEGAATAPGGLVEHATALPVLDISPAEIDLGDVVADEPVPSERIAVINRGGGTLDWTAESSDGWVEVRTDDSGVLLVLKPQPGVNRANVFVRDRSTGVIRTARVRARVISEHHENVSLGAPETGHKQVRFAEAHSPSTYATMPRGNLGGWAPVVSLLPSAAALTAGCLAVLTVANYLSSNSTNFPLLRNDRWGTGLFDSAVLGGALALAGLLALAPLWRGPLLSACFGFAVLLFPIRVGDELRMHNAVGPVSRGFFAWTLAAASAAAVLALLSLHNQRSANRWVRPETLLVAMGSAILWALGHLIHPYNHGGHGGPGLSRLAWILVAAAAGGLVAVAARIEWIRGISLLCAVAVLPVVDLAGDLIWRVNPSNGGEAATIGWWLTYLPVIVLVGTVGSLLRAPPEASARVGSAHSL